MILLTSLLTFIVTFYSVQGTKNTPEQIHLSATGTTAYHTLVRKDINYMYCKQAIYNNC